MGTDLKFLFEEEVTMRQGTNLGSQIGRWIVLAAVVALLGALLLTIRPAGAQSTAACEKIGDDEVRCTYVEGGTDPVYRFDDGGVTAPTAWIILTVIPTADEGRFRIDQESGVLTFKSPPSYESPLDNGTDNTYNLRVRVGFDFLNEHRVKNINVTVTVTNKEEDGTVTLNNLQPQVRERISATLADPDGDATVSTWQWSRSSSRSSGYTPIAGATTHEYRPVAEDEGMHLRATVTYTDGHGPEVDEAMTESSYPVRPETGADNHVPVFAENTAVREIDENTPGGTNIGPPIFATDDDLDVLTYSLSDGVQATSEDGNTEDDGLFSIDPATGQLKTKAGLNFEGITPSGNLSDRNNDILGSQLRVTVLVKDPLGNRADNPALDSIVVDITVNDVNEAPAVSVAQAVGSLETGLLIRHEERSGPEVLLLDAHPLTSDPQVTTFVATDSDDPSTNIEWELSGPDASKFRLGAAGASRTGYTSQPLQFKTDPDFEKPGDADKDNLYQVTVVARDSKFATGSRDVTIRVTNLDEGGEVTLSHIQPEIRQPLIATPSDPDGNLTNIKYQWYRGDQTGAETNTLAVLAAKENCTAEQDNCRLSGETSATYTPERGDVDDGGTLILTVVVTYNDPVETNTDKVVRARSQHPVRAAVSPNVFPYFQAGGAITYEADEDLRADVDTLTRHIKENQDIGTHVSQTEDSAVAVSPTAGSGSVPVPEDAVTATDAAHDLPLETTDIGFLQYKLDQDASSYFSVDFTNQAEVVIRTKKKLDREVKPRHDVTVTVIDPSGNEAEVKVIINVVDVAESPEIDDAGPTRIKYMENGTGAVANYTATDEDEDGTGIAWAVLTTSEDDTSLDQDDLRVVQKSGPQTMLAFKKSPNYESPKGGGAGASPQINIYTVTLMATINSSFNDDGNYVYNNIVAIDRDTVTIKVGVIDEEEKPDFQDDSDIRTVKEHTKDDLKDGNTTNDTLHRIVGVPVVATDSDGDQLLTYSLSGTDAGSFTIVPATGQIMTTKRLDFETRESYNVVVTATDPTDLSDRIDITIEVEDVGEAPDIVPDEVRIIGSSNVSYNEDRTNAVGTYRAEGPDAASATWSLEGDDAGHFRVAGSGVSTTLHFKSAPDYEMPRGAEVSGTNTNTYAVTLKAEASGVTATLEVAVTIGDVEEPGTVNLSTALPVVGSRVTASLSDGDGSITDLTWTWETSSDKVTWSEAPGAETNVPSSFTSTYTTVAADLDNYLRVTARYNRRLRPRQLCPYGRRSPDSSHER